MYKYTNDAQKRSNHEAVRNNVGWYYFTHCLLEVKGAEAGAFLDYVSLNSLAKTGVGRAKYTTLLNEDGKIIDDVIIFHIGEDLYWVSTLYIKDLTAWFDAHKGGYAVEYRDITPETDMFAVQGPNCRALMNAILEAPVDAQKYFSICDNKVGDIPVKISRSGFTGELGYEIYVAPAEKKVIAGKLTEAGKAINAVQVRELEVMTLTLATEKGFVLMSDIKGLSPLEVDPGVAINWDKEFIGKEALREAAEEGVTRQLLGFTIDADGIRVRARNWNNCGHAVFAGDEEVGEVTKFTYGYTLGKSIGFALVDTTKVKVGDAVKINGYDAVLTERIWHDPESKRPLGKA